MQSVNLIAKLREGTGKQVVRKLRAEGIIPATLYGGGEETISLQLGIKDIEQAYVGHEAGGFLIDLAIEGGESTKALIREKQIHPVSGHILHLDFLRIRMDQKIVVKVPVHLVGEAAGVKDFGGVLEHVTRMVEVSCLPGAIPGGIDLDVSELNINDSIHMSDVEAQDFEFVTDAERLIVQVAPPRLSTEVEEAAEGEEGVEGEEGAEGTEGAEGEEKTDSDEETS